MNRPTFQDGWWQNPYEWDALMMSLPLFNSALEIGCNVGLNLKQIAAHCNPGAIIRSIDYHNRDQLWAVAAELAQRGGFDAQHFAGDSRGMEAQLWASQWAPYDFIFIDGDHAYESVCSDWLKYGPMGKTVALHDIAGQEGPRRLWQEIKRGSGKAFEYIATGDEQLLEGVTGIGWIVR